MKEDIDPIETTYKYQDVLSEWNRKVDTTSPAEKLARIETASTFEKRLSEWNRKVDTTAPVKKLVKTDASIIPTPILAPPKPTPKPTPKPAYVPHKRKHIRKNKELTPRTRKHQERMENARKARAKTSTIW